MDGTYLGEQEVDASFFLLWLFVSDRRRKGMRDRDLLPAVRIGLPAKTPVVFLRYDASSSSLVVGKSHVEEIFLASS